MKTTPFKMLMLLLVLALVACGGGDSAEDGGDTGGATAPAGGETLSVVATEFAFDPAELSAPADTDVTVSLANSGNIDHDFVIRDQSTDIAAGPGETATGTFNLPAGSYTFYCSIPGHESAGMVGTLTVG